MAQGQAVSGPLEIHWTVERTASQAWYNQGGKPGGVHLTSYFSVKHQDKPVVVATGDNKAMYYGIENVKINLLTKQLK